MENVDKTSLLKELDFYSRLLEKHEALKKEKDFKSTSFKQARVGQQSTKTKPFCHYKMQKHQSNPTSYFNQKYSLKNSTHVGQIDPIKKNGLYDQRQTFVSKYSLSKNKVCSNVNKFATNSKSLNSNDSAIDKLEQNLLLLSSELTASFSPKKDKISSNSLANMHPKSSTNSKHESIKISCMPSHVPEKSTYDTKDFIREVESLTKLIKKKTSGNAPKVLNSASKSKNVMENKSLSFKNDQNQSFGNISFLKKQTGVSKTKSIVKKPLNVPASVSYTNRRNILINSNNKIKTLKQEVTSVNRFVYNKSNVKPSVNRNSAALLKAFENKHESKDDLKIVSKSPSRRVIYSNSKSVLHDVFTFGNADVFEVKPDTQSSIKKIHNTPKNISSKRKVLKMSPHTNKTKSPVLSKMKSSSAVKTPKIMKMKQTNSRYKIVNKRLITPNKGIQLQLPIQHRSSVKRIKKKVNKYKVINKTLTPTLKEKLNVSHSSVSKSKSPSSMDCDSFLENLNNSAVEKLEQNLLVMSSELTASLLPEKNKMSSNNLAKVSPKLGSKKTPFKKSKSRISKYKIVNLNVSHKYSLKNKQSIHLVTPLKKERAVLVRRLFKSKNAIINKNATPTNYRAKMIKSKYLSLNKRKAPSYAYPTTSLHPKLKGSVFITKLHQNRFKTVSTYHSRLIRKANYGCQLHKNKLVYKNNVRKLKNKINNRYSQSPIVFIRGTRYSKNINGKTLKKLPIKGQLAKNFRRSSYKLIMRTPDLIKTIPASTSFASRVLHRSINRILTASSKKTTSKINTYCMFYNRFGRCNRGVKCSYIHDPSKIAVCTRFLRGTCKNDGCPFSHEVDPGKMAICSLFLVGQCNKENCLYRHEKLLPNAVLCKEFVQGYCHYGKECKKAHILICPKYMQGECDKGSSCAFPHPPQKSKKNIENEEPKPTEVLLEKVLRYFQQGGDTEKEDKNNLFVPKQRKLEEQPAFIPLSSN